MPRAAKPTRGVPPGYCLTPDCVLYKTLSQIPIYLALPEGTIYSENRRSIHVLKPLPLGMALCLVMLIMVACNRTPPTPTPIPVPGVLPTGTSFAVLAGTPSGGENSTGATPTPNLTPTVTPIPEERLDRARQLYRFGNYEAVREELALLADTISSDSTIFAESQFLLALALNEEGFYSQVLGALEPLLAEYETFPDGASSEVSDEPGDNEEAVVDNLIVQAEMLAIGALNSLGQYSEALARYDDFVDQHPWSTEVVQEKLGGLLLALGDANGAADAYRAAAAVSTDASSTAFLLETVAQIELGNGRNDQAIEAYEGILAVAKRPAYRAQIQYRAGKAAEAAGDEREAIGYWIASTDETVNSDDAHSALVELVTRNVDFNLYQRGLINLNNEVWIPAVNAFQAYLDAVPPTDKRAGNAMLGLAQANMGLGNYADALTIVNNLLDSYPDCDCRGDAWLEKALAQAWLGDSVGAHRTYRTFSREEPDAPNAAEGLWESGLLAYREGSKLEGAADLLALVDGFPESERAPLALYLLGLGAYREGLWDQSAFFFERQVTEYPGADSAAAGYWAGRSYDARSRISSTTLRDDLDEKARQAWEDAAKAEPGEYYSVLAAAALTQESPSFSNFLPSVTAIDMSSKGLADDDGSQAFAETWLAEWAEDESPNSASQADCLNRESAQQPWGELPQEIANDANWLQGKFFLALNQRGDALPLLERLLDEYGDDPRALYALSLAYDEIGAYRLSLIAANNLITISPANFVEVSPTFLQRLIYPRRFAELVDREAGKHNIDPKLFYSLIRQESLFEEGARSYAAAQGLAQIIPDTGEWVAEKVGYPNYTNGLIYRPYINLWFGAYYLDWARQFLDDNLTSALVGYNAGPGNSQQWRQESGDDDALFVEVLTYSEPRLYIHKITSNYYHYVRLYP